ncbi:MAG: hypothetical protein D6740_09950 [Alphaproteobacteria bacterium]|nr:MAG: hypothetical protein D6740_09950 [Alphaproteobacteria bacterium]
MTAAIALPPPIPPAVAPPGKPRTAHEAARQFEAVFLQQMLKPMFASVGRDPLFGGGAGEEIYRDFLVDALARALAKAGGIGIAKAVEGEIATLRGETGVPDAAAAAGLAAYRRNAALGQGTDAGENNS